MTSIALPKMMWFPANDTFAAMHADACAEGTNVLRRSSVVFVGLARNCQLPLERNLSQLLVAVEDCASWRLHIEANDCDLDATRETLEAFCATHANASHRYQTLGRQQLSAEFAGRRTIAMAEYRGACQQWVVTNATDAAYVVVVDWDAWGGWHPDSIASGVGWLERMPDAYGMASVSLFQADLGGGPDWFHYDLWALRGVGQRACYFDAYRNRCGGWGFSYMPPIGSPPVLVSSAFGGMCIYRTADYLAGTYDGKDCEHVTFHESIHDATGRNLYMNPSQRMLMSWMEAAHGNGEHSVPDVSGDA